MKIRLLVLVTICIFNTLSAFSQTKTVKGIVTDENGSPLPGVTVLIDGTTNGTITNLDGAYNINAAPSDKLIFSYVGYVSQTNYVGEQTSINVKMLSDISVLDEVIVIGYGVQKKESLVGSISQVKNEDIQRAAQTSDLTTSLTGLMPGVVTINNTGEPGENSTEIYIRGQSTWNGGQPLILVDGIKRGMSDIDPNEVQSISVLKDASATAVFGIEGANGVILITTKRGAVGKPKLSIDAQTQWKSTLKMPEILDSYNARTLKNYAAINELATDESKFYAYYTPEEELEYFRTGEYPELFPNTNMKEEYLNDFSQSHKVNMNVAGGTKHVKYFGSLSYLHDGGIVNASDVGQDYDPAYSFKRINFRSNLDFSITSTTTLSVNLSGMHGIKKEPKNTPTRPYDFAPDHYPVQYEDGIYANSTNFRFANPLPMVLFNGTKVNNRTEITTDYLLKQNLDIVTKGLSFKATFAYDNSFSTSGPQINDDYTLTKYLPPELLYAENAADSAALIETNLDELGGITHFNYVDRPYSVTTMNANGSAYRKITAQAQFDYSRKFNQHSMTALALVNTKRHLTGEEFKDYQIAKGISTRSLDYVGRITYDYDKRYFLDFNGSYTGSEKFANEYKFGFFPSCAVGWMLSNEQFIKDHISQLNVFKVKYSWGEVGNDKGIPRWGYLPTWDITNSYVKFGIPYVYNAPEASLNEGLPANPNLHWETATKNNLGVELALFQKAVMVNFDYFWENREEMFIESKERNDVLDVYGTNPSSANIGATKTTGYEAELILSKNIGDLVISVRGVYSFAKDEVVKGADPELAPTYQKREGYQIDQTRTFINQPGIMQTWDDVYNRVLTTDGGLRSVLLPGDWAQVDYNADGIIDNRDEVPFGYPTRPQYLYSFTPSLSYKGFIFSIQFYGVRNVSAFRDYDEFYLNESVAREFHKTDAWIPEIGQTESATYRGLRIGVDKTDGQNGDYWVKDRSYLKIQNAELAFELPKDWLKKSGITGIRAYINGNNLAIWNTAMDASDIKSEGYPVTRTITFGLNLSF